MATKSGWLSANGLRTFLTCAVMAVYVARPLLPCETPTIVAGDGLSFVLLTFLLAAGWLALEVFEKRGAIRFGLVEGAWVVLVAWQAVSVFSAVHNGFARAAINAGWEWAGLGVGYLLLRQLLNGDREKRAALITFVSVAVVLSLYGAYQHVVEMPVMREQWEKNADAVLEIAQIKAPPGSPLRTIFESRLYSTEPTATFALANSLAGFLLSWLLVAVGIGWLGTTEPMLPEEIRRRHVATAVFSLIIAMCLMLAKSRASYIAVAAGFVVLPLMSLSSWRRTFQFTAAGAVVAVILVAGGIWVGALDHLVLTEATKSLAFRWHYWQGALRIIWDHPWIGCGLGNFQDEYTRFKLPQASEVISDPHNFVCEVWATSGTPGLLALFAMLIGIGRQAWRAAQKDLPGDSTANDLDDMPRLAVGESPDEISPLAITLVGGIGGFVLAYVVGPITSVGLPWGVLAIGCVLLAVGSACFGTWIRVGLLPKYVPFVAILALLINLLVAGGISFAGVAGTLWLLVAVGFDDRGSQPLAVPRPVMLVLCGIMAVLFGACYLTAYRPALECRRQFGLAEQSAATAREHLLAAAAADPYADEPWRQLTGGDFALWQEKMTPERSRVWEEDQAALLRRRPHSAVVWLDAAERYLSAFRHANDADRGRYLRAAIEHFRKAIEFYPNYALTHAELALALNRAGQAEAAKDEASRGLQLHKQTPHADQKLSADLVEAMNRLINGP
ncbi:MAG TPA: O-antigen ligase family protein [Pirellulales bacterium]|nr:O-antigen ligase family protein [Pirellulales bacterium]